MSHIQFRPIDDPTLIRAPQAIGDQEEESGQKKQSQEFDFKGPAKIDRKIMQWMLTQNPLLFLKTLLLHAQNEELLLQFFGLHDILGLALLKSAQTGTVQKVLQIKGLFSKDKKERKEALFELILSLPQIRQSIKKSSFLKISPVEAKDYSQFLLKILPSKNSE
jgi:hypothetical protein